MSLALALTVVVAAADVGIFTDLDDRVQIDPAATAALPARGDRDRDGIPDALDILRGAKKVALNGARYVEGYRSIPFYL